MNYELQSKKILEKAGISVNGDNPWDIRINDSKVYRRVFSQGSLGLGESYMAKMWDCESLDVFFDKVLRANLDKEFKWNLPVILTSAQAQLFNLQKPSRAKQIGERHYDAGNDLYQSMLDKRMTYTCGYWDWGAKTLDEAQTDKLELSCKKISAKRGNKILDIGGGWGSFAG